MIAQYRDAQYTQQNALYSTERMQSNTRTVFNSLFNPYIVDNGLSCSGVTNDPAMWGGQPMGGPKIMALIFSLQIHL